MWILILYGLVTCYWFTRRPVQSSFSFENLSLVAASSVSFWLGSTNSCHFLLIQVRCCSDICSIEHVVDSVALLGRFGPQFPWPIPKMSFVPASHYIARANPRPICHRIFWSLLHQWLYSLPIWLCNKTGSDAMSEARTHSCTSSSLLIFANHASTTVPWWGFEHLLIVCGSLSCGDSILTFASTKRNWHASDDWWGDSAAGSNSKIIKIVIGISAIHLFGDSHYCNNVTSTASLSHHSTIALQNHLPVSRDKFWLLVSSTSLSLALSGDLTHRRHLLSPGHRRIILPLRQLLCPFHHLLVSIITR